MPKVSIKQNPKKQTAKSTFGNPPALQQMPYKQKKMGK
jgi:hypothetical protein